MGWETGGDGGGGIAIGNEKGRWREIERCRNKHTYRRQESESIRFGNQIGAQRLEGQGCREGTNVRAEGTEGKKRK